MKPIVVKILSVLGILFIPALWILIKITFQVSDRYLPSPASVWEAFKEVQPSFFTHFIYSWVRLIIGLTGGIAIGITLGLQMFKRQSLMLLLYPAVQSIRSVPAAATIPFFLLWFGFSETGKFLLIFLGIAFNLAIATIEILYQIPEKYQIMFQSFKSSPRNYLLQFCLPFIAEKILPTLRFSLSTAMGLVVISEILGSQVGLGYVIEVANSTFSVNVIFAAIILFGIMNFMMDKGLVFTMKKIIFWKI